MVADAATAAQGVYADFPVNAKFHQCLGTKKPTRANARIGSFLAELRCLKKNFSQFKSRGIFYTSKPKTDSIP